MSVFAEMIARYAQPGRVEGIYLREARLEPVRLVEQAEISLDGLVGDHARPGKRAVTLIMAEHLPVIAAMMGKDSVSALDLRRNLVVSGLNLNALKGRQIAVGGATLEITGICAPCSRMEATLGSGGYSAMRGHGGWCAQVEQAGNIRLGDAVTPVASGDVIDHD